MNEKLKNIQLLLLDVDGVMTDGRIIYDANGLETKLFNVNQHYSTSGIGIYYDFNHSFHVSSNFFFEPWKN